MAQLIGLLSIEFCSPAVIHQYRGLQQALIITEQADIAVRQVSVIIIDCLSVKSKVEHGETLVVSFLNPSEASAATFRHSAHRYF
jgi:hypothetical protein